MACVANRFQALVALPPRPQDFRAGELVIHFEKHGREWPVRMTKEVYLRRARRLLAEPVGDGVFGYVRWNGDIVRYNLETNELAVMTADGTIRTFFRPDKSRTDVRRGGRRTPSSYRARAP